MMHKLVAFSLLTASCTWAYAQTPPATVPDSAVLAETGRIKVTKADLDAELTRIPEKDIGEVVVSRNRLATLVENVLVNKTLALEARKAGLDKNANVQKEIEAAIDRVLAKHRTQDILKNAPVPDLNAAAREEFLVNPHRFKYPAHYRLWHTLLRYENTDKAAVQEKAEKVRDLVLKGNAIEKVAKDYSDDQTSQSNGGVNPAVPLESVNPALRPVVEKMKAGDVSAVLDVGTGFFVVKLVELIPERVPKFDEIKLDLIQDARVSFLGTYYKQYIEDIKTDKSLKVDAAMLDSVRKPYLPNLDLIQKPAPKKP